MERIERGLPSYSERNIQSIFLGKVEGAELIRTLYVEQGMESPDGPVVAANAHSSDPHFDPTESG